jgi:tetratricopeptide (TPR) repeat protein
LAFRRRDYAAAIACYDEAIRLDPNNGRAWSSRGDTRLRLPKRDVEAAMQDHNKAIELEPKNAVSHVLRGKAYWLQRDFERALKDFDRAIEIDPGNAAAHVGRANTLLAVAPLGKRDEIRAAFENARRIDPRIATTPWFPEIMPPP